MALLDGLGDAFRQLDCAVLSASDYILGGFGRITGLDQGLATNAINGLRRLRGCDPANDILPPAAPFTGGQCETLYRLRGTGVAPVFNCSGTQVNTVNGQAVAGISNLPGPISSITYDLVSPTDCGFGAVAVTAIGSDGVVRGPITITSPVISGPARVEQGSVAVTIERQDGLPDDCGSPPAEFPEPTNFDVDVDVTFLDEGDNIVNVTIPVEFKPFTIDFNGDISFPFDFNLGGIDFNGDVSFAPQFSLRINPPRLPPGPTQDPAIADEDDEVPLAPRENKVQGVIVTSTLGDSIEASEVAGTLMPDTYVPRLGSVKFAYSFGASTVWSNDIDVKGTRVFIPCPFSQGADAVAATPQPGVTFSLAQVTGPPLATVADLAAP